MPDTVEKGRCREESAENNDAETTTTTTTTTTTKKEKRKNRREKDDEKTLTVGLVRETSLRSFGPGIYATR